MSSDESTGTHISTFSNQTEKEKLKPHTPEQWGEYLYLYFS